MADSEQLEILRQGVGSWNDWRANNPDATVDLAGEDFRDWDLSEVNFRGGNLQRSDFRGTTLNHADLSSATLDRVQMAGAKLSGAQFVDAICTRANFSRVMPPVPTFGGQIFNKLRSIMPNWRTQT